jgi:hypothetical protein
MGEKGRQDPREEATKGNKKGDNGRQGGRQDLGKADAPSNKFLKGNKKGEKLGDNRGDKLRNKL